MRTEPTTALVTGSSGGIGLALVEALLQNSALTRIYAGCRQPDAAPALVALAAGDSRLTLLTLDVTDSTPLQGAVADIDTQAGLDLVINTAGILHANNGMRPEKRLGDIEAHHLQTAFDVNAAGAMRLAQACEPLLKHSSGARFVSLSARVGSIGDNRMGGWYAYRASKAALNMLIKTLAIEWARARPPIICAALHPGTVATDLSAPFTKDRKASAVFTSAEAARYLLTVIAGLMPEHSGGFYAWDGQKIPW